MLRFVGTKDVQALGISSDLRRFFSSKKNKPMNRGRIWRANNFFQHMF
jgi:hypothetical protein